MDEMITDLKEHFVEALENIKKTLDGIKFDDEEDALINLVVVLDVINQVYFSYRFSGIDFDSFAGSEPGFESIDDNKNKKLLMKRFKFLHQFTFDMRIAHKDFEPIVDAIDTAEELNFIYRIILQSLSIANKNNVDEAIGFFLFSIQVEGMTSLRYLQLYLQLIDDSMDDLLDMIEQQEQQIASEKTPKSKGKKPNLKFVK